MFELYHCLHMHTYTYTHTHTHTRYKIVRNRVVWLLGNWVGVKMANSLRPSLYSVLISLLQPSEDLVVGIPSLPPSIPVSFFHSSLYLL